MTTLNALSKAPALSSVLAIFSLAPVLLPPVANAQRLPPARGIFCSAEGFGVWGGRTVPFRYQSSLLSPDRPSASDTLTLYADEEPAGVFGIARGAGVGFSFDAVSGLPPRSDLVASIGPDLSFRVVFTDRKNAGAVATGQCEWNYGS